MTSSELVPTTAGPGRATAVRRRRRAEPDIVSPAGERISASAARKLTNAVPRNSRNARSTRWRSYALWCATYDWAEDEPNSVLSYLSDLGDRGHPANSIEAHFSTLRAMRAIQGTPLSDKEVKACQLVIRHRAGEEADDPLVEPGPLQADAVTLDELRLVVRTLDRTTVRGKLDAAVLLISWWMAARASEPARLNLHDAKIRTVQIEDEDGRKRSRQALVIKVRRSKADQAARGQEVRILAPADQELCPIRALREWLDVLADDGQLTPGPLLHRIDRHGNIGAKAAGRPPKDDRRRGGITADTVTDIIKAAARAAQLTPAPTPEERVAAARAKQEAFAAADAAHTAEEANAILKAWRTARRAARAAVRRITGHSFRRGWIQQSLAAGHPPETVALHSRHSLRSTAFDAYRRKKVPWNQNPTRSLRLPPDEEGCLRTLRRKIVGDAEQPAGLPRSWGPGKSMAGLAARHRRLPRRAGPHQPRTVRPRAAEPLAGPRPSFSMAGRAVPSLAASGPPREVRVAPSIGLPYGWGDVVTES